MRSGIGRQRPCIDSVRWSDDLPATVPDSEEDRVVTRIPSGSDDLSYDGFFGSVVATLYDASLDGGRWPAALLLVARLFAAGRARLVVHQHRQGGRVRVLDGWRVEEEAGAAAPPPGAPPAGGGTAAPGDPATYPAIAETIALDDALAADLALWRDPARGGLSDAERRAYVALLPHLRRALLIYGRICAGDADSGAYLATLDHLGEGVFLVDAELRILHANAAAREMLGGDAPIGEEGAVLTLADRDSLRALRDLVAAVDGAAGRGDGRAGGPQDPTRSHDLLVPRGEGALPLFFRVLPVAGRADGAFGGAMPRAVILVRDAARRGPDLLESLQRVHGLTRAEAEIALAIADGQPPKSIARDRGVAPSTVRSQLIAIYRKMSLSRQAELTAAVARLADQAIGPPVPPSLTIRG